MEDKKEPEKKEVEIQPEREESAIDLLRSIKKSLDEGKTNENVKKWKLPWKARVGKAQAKKGWVGVVQVNENKNLDMYKVKVEEGVFTKEQVPHLATPNYVLNYKNKPVVIVPTWSVTPFSPQKNYEEAVEKKTLSAGFKLLANHLEKGKIDEKKKLGLAPIIIIGVLVALGYGLYKAGVFG